MFAWELAEMARRLLLVGVLVIVPFERGSIMQLVLATVICIVYLLIQTLVSPCVSTLSVKHWGPWHCPACSHNANALCSIDTATELTIFSRPT